MSRFVKNTALAFLSVGLILAAFMWWHSHNTAKVAFATAIVKRGEIAATISSSGTIEPEEVVDVGAQVAGLIQSFGTDINGKPIDYGSVVAEGAVLARIDDSVYAANLGIAQAQVDQDKAAELSAAANLEQNKAKLDQAEAEWKRAQDLFAAKLTAQVDFDTDKASYEVAKANVSAADAAVAQAKATTVQAQAGLVAAQRNLDFCVIKSPVKGVIIDRRVNIGQTVVSSLNAPSLFLIAKDLTKMQIWVSVNEADVGRIHPGAPATFTCDAFPGRQFTGTVGKVRLNATMTQNVVMYTVEVNTENPDNLLLPYLTANVHFIINRETNVLMVPNAALRWTPSTLAEIAPAARAQAQANPPADPPANDSHDEKNTPAKSGVIWVKVGSYVHPVNVRIGTSDGSETAVTSDDLAEGAEVVIAEATPAGQSAAKNPFMPPVIKR